VLAAGDHVVAAARKPQATPALQGLKDRYEPALHLVQLDIDDVESIRVRMSLVCSSACSSTWGTSLSVLASTSDIKVSLAHKSV